MSKKVAVILAGSGVFDGSEIHEAVITLLALDRAGVAVQCFAPDVPQLHVINHLTGEVMEGEPRNVLVEAARIARGAVKDLKEASAADFDALVIPGGFGVAKNLSDFALKGPEMSVNADLLALAKAFHAAGKPVGLMCIAPALAAAIFGEGVQCTVGTDAGTAAALTAMGASHQEADVNSIVIDSGNKLVTTPAYMLAGNIAEAASGIEKLVAEIVAMA